MKFENVPVFREESGTDPRFQIGTATVVTEDNAGSVTVLIETSNSYLGQFLRQGTLQALSLNAAVTAGEPVEIISDEEFQKRLQSRRFTKNKE